MLKQRIITGVILGAILLSALFFVPLEWFKGASLLVFGYGAYEWSKLAEIKQKGNRMIYAFGSLVASVLIYELYLEQNLWTLTGQLTEQNYLLMLLACVWWTISSFLVLIYPRGNRVWQHQPVVKAIFGYLTLIPAWIALITLREWHYFTDASSGAWLALFVFGLVWSADIGAYFAGKRFGSHKLMPNVSPGKTIEGFLGGMLAVAVLAIIVQWQNGLAIADWLIPTLACVVIGIISAFGDLSESMLKRDAGMKDSGTIFPGHGGLLDRIDSLTAAMPVFLIFFTHFYQ